jgi:hypothetical protein
MVLSRYGPLNRERRPYLRSLYISLKKKIKKRKEREREREGGGRREWVFYVYGAHMGEVWGFTDLRYTDIHGGLGGPRLSTPKHEPIRRMPWWC